MSSPHKFVEFDSSLAEMYLETLEETGMHVRAADAVGTRSREVRNFRNRNPWFEEMCQTALERHRAIFYDEGKRRATEGVVRPIIGGKNRDEVVAHERVYSDSLLALYLKRLDPEFRDRREVTVHGAVNLSDQFDYKSMSPEARRLLRTLLEQMNKDRESEADDE